MSKEQKKEFLQNLLKLRNAMKDTKKKQLLKKMVDETFHGKSGIDRLHSKISDLQNNGLLPYIEIPHVLHTQEHGDLVFRVDKENGGIKINLIVFD